MNGKVTRPLRVFAAVILIVAGLSALDWFLASTELNELHAEAQRAFVEGERLREQHNLEPALDQLRRAHALERKNPGYELALIDALISAGKRGEAEPLLDEVLQRESNDGRANLTAARLMVTDGRFGDAESYYHRAIYGEWPSRADQARKQARLELVDFLRKHGRNQELLAELLPLQEQAGSDAVLQKRIAHLLLEAGSAQRSQEAYRSLIEQNPKDPDLYIGLGEAELVRGEYRRAVAAFVAAYRHRPGDPAIRRRMEFASLIAGLDPTPRQLSSMEKYRRSLRILDQVRADYLKCAGALSDQTAAPATLPPNINNELAEEKLAQAEEIWRARIKVCGPSTSADEEPLRLIMAKLAQ